MKTVFKLWKCLGLASVMVLAALLLTACDGETPQAELPSPVVQAVTNSSVPPSATPVPPTDTALSPTDTPVPPTDTPMPPTDTPVPPTATPAPPTDTPVPPTDTPIPPSPTPAVTNTPKPTPKPKLGKIVFTSNRSSWDDLYVMNDDGSNQKQLTKMGKCYDAHFSPDGKTIFFEHGDDIYKMNAEGGGVVNLTNTTDNIEAYPVVAPNGSRLAYLFAWPAGFEIYTSKLDGSDRKPVTSRSIDWMPAWSPDSKKIAFSSLRSGSFNIWVVNADGSGLTQVTKFGGERIAISPVYSPDGKQIAFSTIAVDTAWEIWVVGVDGSKPHKVVGTVGNDRNNSTFIAAWKKGKFLIGGYQGNWDPYFVPDTGGEPVRVIEAEKDDKPSDWWVP
jgi:Tol biopolymer transport system component